MERNSFHIVFDESHTRKLGEIMVFFAVFKFRIFIIIFYIRANVRVWLYINRLHFNCSIIGIIVFINYIRLFINMHTFWYWTHKFVDFIIQCSNRFFSTNWASFEYTKCISISISCNHDFIDLLQASLPLSTHILFRLI